MSREINSNKVVSVKLNPKVSEVLKKARKAISELASAHINAVDKTCA